MAVLIKRLGLATPLLLAVALVAAASIGVASSSGVSVAAAPKAPLRADVAASSADAVSAANAEPLPATPTAGARRSKLRCVNCGVVESVRRIDRREVASGSCALPDSERLPMMSGADGSDRRGDVPTLADTVEGVVTGRAGAVRTNTTSTYQIVVRFRDGSRRVFNEVTARELTSGERIQVIAGVEPRS